MTTETNERQFLFDVWNKIQNKEKLNATEKMISKIIEMHPEVDSVLSNPEVFADHQFDIDEPDPFSHLGLHAIVMEMVNSDSPSGLRSIYDQRVNQRGDKHEAQHDLMLAVFDWLVVNAEDEMNEQQEGRFIAQLREQFSQPVTDN